MGTTMGGEGAASEKRKKTSPNTTPKKTKRARFVSPENPSKSKDKATTGTDTGPDETTAITAPSKNKVQSGAFIDSSDEAGTKLPHNNSITQNTTTDTVRAPAVASLALRSILKSTKSVRIEKPADPAVPGGWFDRIDTPDRASASGSQRGASRSSRESSIEDHSTDSEVAAQLNADERREFTRKNWAPTQASGGVPIHHVLAAAVAPLTGPELFDHLAESTLIYQHNRAMFDNSTGTSPPEAQEVRNSIIDSIMHYLGPNGGTTQENLARKLARAQAMRVDPRSLPTVNQMMAPLTGPPFGPIQDDDPSMAAALTDLDLTSSRMSESRYNTAADPRRMDSEHGRKGRNGIFDKLHHKLAPPLTERVDWIKKNMAEAPPLFQNDDEDEMFALPTLSASSKCPSKKSKMAPVYVMTKDEIAASAFRQTRTIPQIDGSNDSQMDIFEQDLGQEMAGLRLQPPLIPLNHSAQTPFDEIPAERLNQFILFGQKVHIKSDEYLHPDEEMLQRIKAAYPPEQLRNLSRGDAYRVIEDELDFADAMSISDTGADGGIDDEDEDVSMKDDEDKSMSDVSHHINKENHIQEQAQGLIDAQVEHQIERLVNKHGVQDPPERTTPLPADEKKRETVVERQEIILRAIQENRDKVITGLPYVMRSDWADPETLSSLHRNVQKEVPLPPKAPKKKVPGDRCDWKSHLTKNCKATAPRKGWGPLKGTRAFPRVSADADDGAQGQGGPSKIGKRSHAGYLQALIDSEPSNRFDTRGQARAPLGGFDGAVDSPPHMPAHLPKLGLSEVEIAEAKQQHHGFSRSISLKGEDLSPVRSSRVLSKPNGLPMSKQDAWKANRLREMKNARAYLGGFDGADDVSSEEKFAEPAKMTPAPSRKPGPSSARRVRMLSKPDDLPPSRPPSVDSSTLRGGDLSASIKEGVTKEQDNMPAFKDDDLEMHDVMEMTFPSLLDGRTSDEREESVGLGDFMDEVNTQLMSESMDIERRSEFEQDQAAVNQEVQITIARQALQVALGGYVAQQLLVQASIEVSSQAPYPTGDMSMPPPSSQDSQTRKMLATPNPFRALSDMPDPIEAAGREAFSLRDTPIASTSPTNAAQNPFRRYKRSNVPATQVNVIDDDEDDADQIMFTPLDAKTQTGKVAGITRPAGMNVNDHNNVERTEDSEDDNFQPDLDIAIATPKKKYRKSLTAQAISDVEEIQPKSNAKPKRKTRKSLRAVQTEVPETSDIEVPEDKTKVTASEKKKSARRKAGNTLVADPFVETQISDSFKLRRRATRQSTRAAMEVSETPQTAKSGKMKRQAVEARSEKKNASNKGRRAEAEEAEASEVEEQESYKSTKRSSRTQSIESGDDAVIESVETPARQAKGKQTEKRATRSRAATPRAKSATAEPQSNGSDITVYYDTHGWMLPVEIGDRVVRKLSKEDHRLYSKVDEYDEFTGPWIVLDLKIRKRDKEIIAQVLDENLSEEARSIAWNEMLTALVKISIPEEAQTKDKVSPWVELRTLLPVLDVDGVQSGKLGPAYPLLEDFDSYKALKKKLAMTNLEDGSMNVVRKKQARTRDEDAESSLGLVNLRKNFFVAVVDVDPNWREDDEYEVEKIRKKKLKLVLRSRATSDELDQEDTDKWQKILKHGSSHLNTHPLQHMTNKQTEDRQRTRRPRYRCQLVGSMGWLAPRILHLGATLLLRFQHPRHGLLQLQS